MISEPESQLPGVCKKKNWLSYANLDKKLLDITSEFLSEIFLK